MNTGRALGVGIVLAPFASAVLIALRCGVRKLCGIRPKFMTARTPVAGHGAGGLTSNERKRS